MTDPVTQIEQTLPNGFHDSEILEIHLDYAKRTITFHINCWVGVLESNKEEVRESYRPGKLVLIGFERCIIEPPDPKNFSGNEQSLRVSSGSGNPHNIGFLETVPADTFTRWFFVNEWNAFIYCVARSASFEWQT